MVSNRLVGNLLTQFNQYFSCGSWMEKCDPFVVGTTLRLFIDQGVTSVLETFHLLSDIFHLKREMVNPGATIFDKTGDRTFRIRGLEEFNFCVLDLNKRGQYRLRGHFFALIDF